MKMNPKTVAALALVTTGFLFGCDRPPLQNEAKSVPPVALPPGPTANDGAAGDPSLLPAEAALRRMPKSATDANPDTELTPAERDKAMPLPGQANDHSNPEFAKRGDDSSPAKSARK
jgi:hypothetical protein